MNQAQLNSYLNAAKVLTEDLESLAEFVITDGPVQIRHLRLASVIVRRWFCDNDLVTKIARPLNINRVTVPTLNDREIFEAAEKDPDIAYYLSAGTKFNGHPIEFFYHSNSEQKPIWLSKTKSLRRIEDNIGRAVEKRIMLHEGRTFKMGEVVRFAANKLGGAHLDSRRTERQEHLEKAADYMAFGGKMENLASLPPGELYLELEPESTEWMSGINVTVISAAAMLLNASLDAQPLVNFKKSKTGLDIEIVGPPLD